jgi:toxin HigB-1
MIITLDVINISFYNIYMIKSFTCKETEKVYRREFSRKLPPAIQKMGIIKLWMLDAATGLNDLRIPPNNRLEELHGDRKGQYSIRINRQWRICFEWQNGNALKVEIVDYH